MKNFIEEYRSLVPAHFHDTSRLWIYQADREFTEEEIQRLIPELENFNSEWNSHGDKVMSFVKLFFNRFIILMADESVVRVGGCSTDASYRFLKALEKTFDVQLFDRHSMAFIVDDEIKVIHFTDLQKAAEEGVISGDTLYFNNTVLNKKDFINSWIVLAKESWLSSRVSAFSAV
ncbi:MAG: hypothetical protein J5I50_12740 [Chitinophagaceae bacterium]|nr:hypothetical protein [Chitinophagaceae bacterium]